MINFKEGTVVDVVKNLPGYSEILAKIGSKKIKAVNYPQLTGAVKKGDDVIINTTADNEDKLSNIVLWNKNYKAEPTEDNNNSILKFYDTPLQFSCLWEEMELSEEDLKKVQEFQTLFRAPVLVLGNHLQLGPVLVTIKALTNGEAKTAYVMTDSTSLPLKSSGLVRDLKEKGYLDYTITVGNAFGGDYEAINVYNGIIIAKEVLEADIIVVGSGINSFTSKTRYGASCIEMGENIVRVSALGGVPICVLDISFGQQTKGSYGIKHHNLVALGDIALTQAVVPIPNLEPEKLDYLTNQLLAAGVSRKHILVMEDGNIAIEDFLKEKWEFSYDITDNFEFSLSAGAAASIAVKIMRSLNNPRIPFSNN